VTALIVDDHPVARGGLARLVEQARPTGLIGEAGDAASALRLADELAPELVVVDLRFEEGYAASVLCAQLLDRLPDAKIALFTAFEDIAEIKACLAAGVHGCLLKDTSEMDLVAALRDILDGEIVIHPRIARGLAANVRDEARSAPAVHLTAREREVLALLAEGYSNRMIADTLCLAESTVKGYVAALLEKLEAASRLQAVVQAARLGLFETIAAPGERA
jgi:DNA-binding NarL/FixJ family response regulator